ncbi:MAG: phosphoribosyltransferase family protein [Crocinitomicaceae bacterium]|nr:phosphoribosyltransferase [Crocinitomicaceae bacterium]
MKEVVLNKEQIALKTERIAFEILENTFEEAKIYVGGIEGNGYLFAERIVEELSKNTDQEIRLFKIEINKDAPLQKEICFSIPEDELNDQSVVLVDDVINSGRTMIYAVRTLLGNKLKQLKVATLVNRTHRKFPVQADFVGMNISTTIMDNIQVDLGKEDVAYLVN